VREELGLTTGVIDPQPAWRRSRALSDAFLKQIRTSALAQCQLSVGLTDADGRTIRPPPGW
jgi:hypothetical protein